MGILDLSVVKPIADGLNWLMTLSASEVRHVKDESIELLVMLSRSLKSLWDVTQEVSKLRDEEFNEGFPRVYGYFKGVYYNPEDIESGRTHCTDLRRDVGRVRFKLSMLLQTDLGRWNEAEQALQLNLLDDAHYIAEYNKNFDRLNDKLNEIQGAFRTGDQAKALQLYQALRAELSGDLDDLNAYIKRMRTADGHIREIAG